MVVSHIVSVGPRTTLCVRTQEGELKDHSDCSLDSQRKEEKIKNKQKTMSQSDRTGPTSRHYVSVE